MFRNATGFVFDCDGTLIDSLAAWEEAERELFAQTGPLTQEQEDEIHSAPIERAAEIFHDKYGVGESAEAVLAHLDGHLLDFYASKAVAMPGACEFVRRAAASGAPCVVLSSSPRRYLDAGLKRIGIRDCFLELVTTDESGCSKQDAAIYERALSILGGDAATTWAFDDAPYAVFAMHSSGLKTVCVGERTSEYADANVSSFEELL